MTVEDIQLIESIYNERFGVSFVGSADIRCYLKAIDFTEVYDVLLKVENKEQFIEYLFNNYDSLNPFYLIFEQGMIARLSIGQSMTIKLQQVKDNYVFVLVDGINIKYQSRGIFINHIRNNNYSVQTQYLLLALELADALMYTPMLHCYISHNGKSRFPIVEFLKHFITELKFIDSNYINIFTVGKSVFQTLTGEQIKFILENADDLSKYEDIIKIKFTSVTDVFGSAINKMRGNN